MIYDFEGQTPKIDPGSWVAPNAVIIGRVELKKNSNIWFNTTLRGDLEPIIIGENFHGISDLMTAIDKHSCDMVMPDLMRIGGVSNWLKLAAISEASNIEVSTHLFPEVSAHLMMVTPTADWLEWVDWANPLLEEPYKIINGDINNKKITYKSDLQSNNKISLLKKFIVLLLVIFSLLILIIFIFGEPINFATNTLFGSVYISLGAPNCSMFPLFKITILSASVIAST